MRPAPGRRLAPAKVNLFLHVGPAAPDGYHPVASLMAFADEGDEIALAPADTPVPRLHLDGPFAADLDATAAGDNLVVRAALALLARAGLPSGGFALHLTKRLPVAAGLGGGSADAAAALRLLRDLVARDLDDGVLEELAAGLGADGPACLAARPVVGTGRGDVLAPAPALPALHAVLVNARVACPTGAVYRAYDAGPGPGAGADLPPLPEAFQGVDELVAVLGATRNDLEGPAARLVPAVAETLALVRGLPQCRFARLSGSGATVWALADGELEARSLAAGIARERPAWWTVPCRLGGPWS